jgi:hypothetical protein
MKSQRGPARALMPWLARHVLPAGWSEAILTAMAPLTVASDGECGRYATIYDLTAAEKINLSSARACYN